MCQPSSAGSVPHSLPDLAEVVAGLPPTTDHTWAGSRLPQGIDFCAPSWIWASSRPPLPPGVCANKAGSRLNYFCQVSALTKQALVYSAHLLYSEPPATQLISFEVAFVPILQRSGRARALPFVKVGLQKGRVTLAELAPCPGCRLSASCLQLFSSKKDA